MTAPLAPIAVFAYRRPRHIARVLASLRANPEHENSPIHVFLDGARGVADEEDVARTRAVVRECAPRHAEIVEREGNAGLANSIVAGVTRLTREYGCAIVLEDDLVPCGHFLRYMNEALQRYAHDDRVISAHAYCYPVAGKLPETFFLRGADCWGWATWKRGWDLFEPDGRKLLRELERRHLTREFDFDGSYPYTRMLRDCIAGKNDSWAIRWYASAFLKDKLTLYPGSSQVQNIGADGSGAHEVSTRIFEHAEWGRALELGSIAVEESMQARRLFAAFLAGLRPSLAVRVRRRLMRLASKAKAARLGGT